MSARLPTSTKDNQEYLRIAFLHLLNRILMICKHDRWHCAHRCILSLKLQYNLSIVESNQPIDEIPSLLDVSTTTKKTNPQNLEKPGTLSLSPSLFDQRSFHLCEPALFFHTGISSHSSSFKETNDSIHTANCDGSQTPKTNVWKWKAWNPDRDTVKMPRKMLLSVWKINDG